MTDQPKERIVSAAIYLGGIISLPRPARHGDIISTMDQLMHIDGPLATPDRQGFITDTGRYVNRVEAYGIAWKAKQIISGSRGPQLFSEDLW